ncbi:MAG: Pyridoxamine 5-phosphate oxidase [Candidatus Paceibacter sp.]|jgi:uncharacterized pyridoxamine 5'-phosphate oxidase family protein|nr:Pyridoxamine 5-phosphate oxidase [Candidatus Paceibacter sp.]
MNPDQIKFKILNFLKNHTLTVISTIDERGEKPESAVIAFAEKENLELIFATSNTTRKYKNLQKNPHVSFVIGWDSKIGTVQYEGSARELSDDELNKHADIMILKNKQSEKFRSRPDQRYFLVKPTWIRLLDMSSHPDQTFEINL